MNTSGIGFRPTPHPPEIPGVLGLDYLQKLRNRLHTVYERAQDQQGTAPAKQKQEYNVHSNNRDFAAGDRRRPHALLQQYLVGAPMEHVGVNILGPFTVSEATPDTLGLPNRSSRVHGVHTGCPYVWPGTTNTGGIGFQPPTQTGYSWDTRVGVFAKARKSLGPTGSCVSQVETGL
ncbi:hypothetical protein ROHU_014235 [Labeo rohita]|uniref:Uncharacterized protein n=1 Tax=Labeo rohita TaxID=84645 RepID=A0A498NU07_LABRO|nr:hypothetical protein ROHU_014235 [Labeo rohita]